MRRKTRPLLQSSDIALGLSQSFKSTINPQSWVMQCAPRLPSEVERSWAAWPALKYFIHLSKATVEVINKVCNAVNHFYSRHYTLIKLRFPQASWRQPQTKNASSPVSPKGCLASSPRGRGAIVEDAGSRSSPSWIPEVLYPAAGTELLGKLHPRQHHPCLCHQKRDVFVSGYLALTLLWMLQLTPGCVF